MLIAVDKPTGMSSFDIIRALKRELQEKKIGHSGTLDPMATGLLLIGTNKDTKQLQHLTGLNKEYITTIDFSKISDTRDMDYREKYEELDISTLTEPTIEQIKEKLDSIIPKGELPLTPFSAKKKDGKKLYELARKGEQIIENKTMKINGYTILNYNFPLLEIKINVGSGTYIRSIGYRLGQQFGLGGILTKLRRTSIDKYNLNTIKLYKTGTFFIKSRGENGETKRADKGKIKFTYGILQNDNISNSLNGNQ